MVVIRLRCSLPAYHSKPSLICDFCPSDQRFAYSFLQIPPHSRHPCCSAIHFPLPGHVRDLHPLERAHGAQTKKRAPFTALFHIDFLIHLSYSTVLQPMSLNFFQKMGQNLVLHQMPSQLLSFAHILLQIPMQIHNSKHLSE